MPMRCHYEVIGVGRDATSDDIKKQYKKLALQWHPDRNHGQEDAATAAFKEISAAYSVLSDSNERAWYDSHRESILRGGDGTTSEEDDGGLMNLFQYFNSSAFSGFDDSPQGFFGVYGAVFAELQAQEVEKGSGKISYPVFGAAAATSEEVLHFYAQWENYISEMTFAWTDQYNVLEAPNRTVKRAMEKENSKARDTARKEWVGRVRSLASFVKKRDPRYALIESARTAKRKEAEGRKAKAKADEALQRKERREAWKNQEEDQDEKERRMEERKGAYLLADSSSDEEDELVIDEALLASLSVAPKEEAEEEGDDGGEGEVHHCEVCSKSFQSAAQLSQHNASKVHRKKVTEAARKKR